MVHGLNKFKEYFANHTNQYAFIGGTACVILLDELGASFRATKDLDIVLIIEALDASFCTIFRQFIEDGGYAHREKNTGKDQFYRFSNPISSDYPAMIELFSRKPDCFDLKFQTGLTPIHIDESVISLSAILLNDVYYDLLIKGKVTIDGLSVIDIETIILFKIKAWLDLKQRLDHGDHVDSRSINKHKNDVFRLLANVNPSRQVKLVNDIMNDIRLFCSKVDQDKPDLKNLGISKTSYKEMIKLLESIYK